MPLLALKFIIAPLLIGGTSLAARRWGHAVAGLVVSLPLTSGPVVVFVALEHGSGMAGEVGLATLAGGFALCAFALVTAAAASVGLGPIGAVAAGSAVFGIAALLIDLLDPGSLVLLAPLVGLALALTLWLLPAGRSTAAAVRPPRWDLPVRIVVGTALIVGISTAAPIVGPRAAGLLATYPVYLGTLTVFAHLRDGPLAAVAMQRGLITGLFGWLGFWTVLLAGLPAVGIAIVVPAVATAVAIQVPLLRFLRVPAVDEPEDLVP